jgi:SAM-dependent methyltransferase
LLNSRISALARRLLPETLTDKLDPFEAAIEEFVRKVARETTDLALVLDAGAGQCRFKPFFPKARYLAIDFGQGDLEWDYSTLDVIGLLEELPLPENSVDHILSIVVLEHTPRPAKVLQEFYRVLKYRGMLHIVVPHMWEEHQRPHDYYRYTSSGVRFLLQDAGFRIRKIQPVGGFFWQLGRRLMGVLSFTQQGWRWLLFPVLAPVFGFVLPLCCYYLDSLDTDRAYTLGYICEAWKE